MLQGIRAELESVSMVISGCIGPADDGYSPEQMMSAIDAQAYHAEQIQTFAARPTDMVTVITMTYTEEAIGIARAAAAESIPVVISFTVETDGCLPNGQSLESAIGEVDAHTENAPAYYMINCAHPVHFTHALKSKSAWTRRIRGLRANASRMSHAELDQSKELDTGDPKELAALYQELRTEKLPNLVVMGGCCGTDHTHMEAICQACLPVT